MNCLPEIRLILAVLELANRDLDTEKHRMDAVNYFHSDLYKFHLDILELAPDTLPVKLGGGSKTCNN